MKKKFLLTSANKLHPGDSTVFCLISDREVNQFIILLIKGEVSLGVQVILKKISHSALLCAATMDRCQPSPPLLYFLFLVAIQRCKGFQWREV